MWYCHHEYSSLVQLWVQIIMSSVLTCWLAFRHDDCQLRKYRRDLFKQYVECKKYNLIPKLEYNKILHDVKCAAANSITKSKRDYYQLAK